MGIIKVPEIRIIWGPFYGNRFKAVSQNISPSLLVLVWKFPFAWRVNS